MKKERGELNSPGEQKITTLHPLEKGDMIERLVDANRIPSGFAEMHVGKATGSRVHDAVEVPTPQIICLIPPEGTQKGDVLLGSYADGFEVGSPEGKIRGPAKMHFMTQDQALRIRERVMRHYELINPPKVES